jgi:molybdenum cofactor guanylyltransferase
MKAGGIIGLVLAGGSSRRMGSDKSLIPYHGKPQREYLYELLSEFCSSVYICCKSSQQTSLPEGFLSLIDERDDIGPAAALLTAFDHYPQASFLITACDYPLLDAPHIRQLLAHRTKESYGVCFRNEETGIPEALIGFYENSCKNLLQAEASGGHYSLRYFIESVPFTFIKPRDPEVIRSIDTKDQSLRLMNELAARKEKHS